MAEDCECEVCKKGPALCDKCDIEMKKGEYKKTDEGIETTELICPKCKRKKMDIKVPRHLYDQNVFAG